MWTGSGSRKALLWAYPRGRRKGGRRKGGSMVPLRTWLRYLRQLYLDKAYMQCCQSYGGDVRTAR